MSSDSQVKKMTEVMSAFTAFVGKKLPDDVEAKLVELRGKETGALSKTIYDAMAKNQQLAMDLNRPCCQDNGNSIWI